jgi:hypothetical protein
LIQIYDLYAVKMLPYHLSGKSKESLSYEKFADSFLALKKSLNFSVTTRELDRYLWLSGQLRAWRGLPPWRKHHNKINSELRCLFESSDEKVQKLIGAVLGRSKNL